MSSIWLRLFPRAAAGFVLVGLCLPSALAAAGGEARETVPTADSALAALRSMLQARVERGDMPSLAIGVARGETVLWEEGLGWADRERGLRATADTPYAVASISKALTATVLARLAAAGHLRWDDPLPKQLGLPTGLTLRHLVNHSSGLPHAWWYEESGRETLSPDRATILSFGRAAAFRTGEGFLYSNLNFEYAALAAQEATGVEFPQLVRRELARPLGLGTLSCDRFVGQQEVAAGYRGGGLRVEIAYRLRPCGGAGFFASTRDLLRFARAHLGSLSEGAGFLPAEALAELHGDAGSAFSYSAGWGRVQLADGDVALVSDGEMLGAQGAIVLLERRQIALVVLANVSVDLFEIVPPVLDAVDSGLGATFLASVKALAARWTAPGSLPRGVWRGTLDLGGSQMPIELDFGNGNDGSRFALRLAGEEPRCVTGLSWDRGLLTGTIPVALPLPSDAGRSHHLQLTLHIGADLIRGFITDALNDRETGRRLGRPYLVEVRLVPVKP